MDYEKDVSQAINRLEIELSVKNNTQILSLQEVLRKIKENIPVTSDEKRNLIDFLCKIPIFKENIKDIQQGGYDFIKFGGGIQFKQYERGRYIYRKKQFIDSTFWLIRGEVCKIDEKI